MNIIKLAIFLFIILKTLFCIKHFFKLKNYYSVVTLSLLLIISFLLGFTEFTA